MILNIIFPQIDNTR